MVKINVNGKDFDDTYESGILIVDGVEYNEVDLNSATGNYVSLDGKSQLSATEFQNHVNAITAAQTASPLDSILGTDADKLIKKNGTPKAVTMVKAPDPTPAPAPITPEAPKAPQAPKPIEAPKAPQPPKPVASNEGNLEDLLGPATTTQTPAPTTSAPKPISPYEVPAQDAYRVKDGAVQAKYAKDTKVYYLGKEDIEKVLASGKITPEQATDLKLTILAKELETLDAKPATEKNLAFLREYQTKLTEYNALNAPKKAKAEWDLALTNLGKDLMSIETIVSTALANPAANYDKVAYDAFVVAYQQADGAYQNLMNTEAENRAGKPAMNAAQKIWSNVLLAAYRVSQGKTGAAIDAQKTNLYSAVAKVLKAVGYAVPEGNWAKESVLKETVGAGHVFAGEAGVPANTLLTFYNKNIGK